MFGMFSESLLKNSGLQQENSVKSFLLTFAKETMQKVHLVIENRGGLACLLGLILVPAQYCCPGREKSEVFIERASQNEKCKIERFDVPVGENSLIRGVIVYPENWNPQDTSSCVLYHNPNAVTVSGYVKDGGLSWTPDEIVKLAQCPIILYDYRGTGLNQQNFAFGATYESIVVDGEAMLRHALKSFHFVKVIGSSLGAGVGTASLDRHLTKHPEDISRVSLMNHDSFSTTPRVIFPYLPKIADAVGHLLGGMLDAITPMKNLIEKGVQITILCHEKDPVIPKGARMAEWIDTLPPSRNVSVIYSPENGHANLSQDMCRSLQKI